MRMEKVLDMDGTGKPATLGYLSGGESSDICGVAASGGNFDEPGEYKVREFGVQSHLVRPQARLIESNGCKIRSVRTV